MDFEVNTDGFTDAIEELKDLEEDLGRGGPWVVGTAVNYSLYLEFGTRHMDPKPFFRPVLSEVRMQGVEDFIDDNTRTTVQELDDVDAVVRTLALSIERRVKEVITKKGLIDTGTLRASVAAVPGAGAGDLPSADDIDASGDGLPSDVGPEIREDIEVTT